MCFPSWQGYLAFMSSEKPEELTEEERIAARLAELQEKTAVSHQLPEVPEWNYKRPETKPTIAPGSYTANAKSLGIGMSVAYTMSGSVIGGFGTGWLLDRATHHEALFTAILGLGGATLGVVGTILLVSKANAK